MRRLLVVCALALGLVTSGSRWFRRVLLQILAREGELYDRATTAVSASDLGSPRWLVLASRTDAMASDDTQNTSATETPVSTEDGNS